MMAGIVRRVKRARREGVDAYDGRKSLERLKDRDEKEPMRMIAGNR